MSLAVEETDRPLVIIVDDDVELRKSLQELMRSVGIEATGFGSPGEMLGAGLPERVGCLVLDVRMPGLSGLDLQQRFATEGYTKPVIFLTGHGDIPMSVQAMKAGAVDFLTKPVRGQTLLDAVSAGIERDIAQRAAARIARRQMANYATLTPREREVLREVAHGRLNKQIAYDLGISEITVKLHRGNVMKKMKATSIGELIRAWEVLPAKVHKGDLHVGMVTKGAGNMDMLERAPLPSQ